MTLAPLGFATVLLFIVLIMTKRMSAAAALIAVPIVGGLLAGAGPGLGDMMLKGIVEVAPIATMLAFAVLYFAVMMDSGLFDPLVNRILAVVGNDPVRIAIGTMALSSLVSLDGDGTTTALIVITSMLPLYRAIGMNPLILAMLLGSSNAIMNLLPWGGPSARAAAAVKVDLVHEVFLPLVPAMLITLSALAALAWWFGMRERARLGWKAGARGVPVPPIAADRPERRPRLFWFNLLLTAGLMAGMVTGIAPLPVLIMGALAVALTVNYPKLSDQRERITTHADNVVMVVVLIFAAGAFTGILGGTGMTDAMARALLAGVPDAFGAYLAPITALLALPLAFVMSNDAYYFGVVPVLAQAGIAHGIPAEAIARASLMGGPVHSLSPLLAPVYLACGLLGVDVADAQRFALKYAVGISLVMTLAAIATGAIPLGV